MLIMKTAGLVGLIGALLATAACGDSSRSLNPTAPSAVVAASMNDEAGDANATSGPTGKPVNPGNGNGNGNGNGRTPSTATPPAPPPTNPTTGKVEIEGLISAIADPSADPSITVNGQTVAVTGGTEGTVIRHGSRTVAYSALGIGDRVHITARMQDDVLEATEVKLQNPGGGDDDEAGGG